MRLTVLRLNWTGRYFCKILKVSSSRSDSYRMERSAMERSISIDFSTALHSALNDDLFHEKALTTFNTQTHIKVVKAIMKKVCGDTGLGFIKIFLFIYVIPVHMGILKQ